MCKNLCQAWRIKERRSAMWWLCSYINSSTFSLVFFRRHLFHSDEQEANTFHLERTVVFLSLLVNDCFFPAVCDIYKHQAFSFISTRGQCVTIRFFFFHISKFYAKRKFSLWLFGYDFDYLINVTQL